MESSILRLGSAMQAYEKAISVVSNNISNALTPGYKADNIVTRSFDDALSLEIENSNNKGELRTKYFQLETMTNFTQGNLRQTDYPNDIALSGSGFMTVDDGGTAVYLRSTQLSVDAEGYLIDSRGNHILGENGPINTGAQQVVIAQTGDVYGTETQTLLGRLMLRDFENAADLTKQDDYFISADGAQPTEALCRVEQGYREMANVDVTQEYLTMMSISTGYETLQRVVQMIDEINGKSVSEIGQI